MKDIPVFTTENGVASLTLREIPYSRKAYFRIQLASDAASLIKECVDFCRAVGAEEIYATGDASLKDYPVHTEILEMRALRSKLPDTDTIIEPLYESQLSEFQSIYNAKMRNVPNSAYFTIQDAKAVFDKHSGYRILSNDELIGIGIASGDTIEMLASLLPEKGCDVICALSKTLQSDEIRLVVADTNYKAIRLYERLGFKVYSNIGKWYKIF